MRNGRISARAKWEHHTDDGVCSSWPTLLASDYKGPDPTALVRHGRNKGDKLPTALYLAGERGPLNPRWAEWLMGFPPGWSESRLLATRLFQP
jgi:hypothetical protein